VFGLVARLGAVPQDDLERTLNLGVGMVAVVAPDRADEALARLRARSLDAWALGTVAEDAEPSTGGGAVRGAKGVRGGAVQLVGSHPR
jgi:phosphoribosylformylglycinamidine cyclo-ligase